MLRKFVLTALAISASAASAQEPAISTDRPSESAAPGVVPRGSLQFEMGYKFTRADDADEIRIDTQSAPDLLFRVGVSKRLEGRLTAEGWSFKNRVSGKQDGFNDVSVGMKAVLLPEGTSAFPATSILAEVALPVGSTELTGEFVNPKVLALFQESLSDQLSLTANFGTSVLRLAANEAREQWTVVDLPYTAMISGTLSERLGWFAELFGAFALQEREDRHSLQAGLTVAVGSRFQIGRTRGDWTGSKPTHVDVRYGAWA